MLTPLLFYWMLWKYFPPPALPSCFSLPNNRGLCPLMDSTYSQGLMTGSSHMSRWGVRTHPKLFLGPDRPHLVCGQYKSFPRAILILKFLSALRSLWSFLQGGGWSRPLNRSSKPAHSPGGSPSPSPSANGSPSSPSSPIALLQIPPPSFSWDASIQHHCPLFSLV